MDYLLEVLTAIVKHGLSYTTIGVSLIALFKVNGIRKILLRRLPKRFRHEDRLERIERNQGRIERKLDAIAAHTGVPKWEDSGALKTVTSGPTSLKPWWRLSQVGICRVNQLRGKEPMKINKAILVPIASSIAGFVKESTGYEITQEYLDLGVNFILFVVIPVMGYFMHPRKKGDELDALLSSSIERTE